jgi:hypothetical protein
MIRFNIVRNLLVVSALLVGSAALGGCAAPTSSSSDVGQSDNPLGHTELVAVDGNGNGIAPNAERAFGRPTPVGNEANGPQPEPWNGIDDPNGAPQPEPWRPKKIAPEPDPDQASPSSTPPKP